MRTLGPFAAALVFLATINLRPAITAVGPLIENIGEYFVLGPTLLGLLGSIPLIMFGLLSPFSSWFAAKLGVDRVFFIVLVAISAGILIRSYAGLPGLWIGVILATGAIAVGNVLVPALIKRDYPGKIAFATAVYTATMGFGSSVASGLAVPVATKTDWQFSLALWAIPAFLVAIMWLMRINASTPQKVVVRATSVNVWKSSTAWWLTLFMGLQSSTFYFMITWLPSIQMASGKTAAQSGTMLFWFQLIGISVGMFLPLLMKNRTNLTLPVLISSVPMVIAYVGMITLPQHGFVWSIVMGVGSGSALVVSLTLVVIKTSNQQETSKLSGMVQSLGYFMAAVLPIAAGMLFEATGSWKPVLVMMLCIAILQTSIATIVGDGRRKITSSSNTEK